MFNAYDEIFTECMNCVIIEQVSENPKGENDHYLPHHAVFKESSLTSKVQPGFDTSVAAD